MHKRVIEFLNDQKILCKNQFRFQKNFSTAHAIITFPRTIKKTIDYKLFVNGIIDLQKAFYTVDRITYCFINFFIMELEI